MALEIPVLMTTGLLSKMTEWSSAGNLKDVERAKDLIRRTMDYVGRIPKGPERAKRLQKNTDRLLEKIITKNEELASSISCRAGCSACCNIQVMITEDEADLLYELVKSEGIEIDRDKLAKQATWDEDGYTANYRSGEAACVFLDPEKKLCRVYGSRPMACRSYLVASPPELCVPDEPHKVQALFSPDVACFETAAMSADLKSGDLYKKRTLPALLLERIENDRTTSSNH